MEKLLGELSHAVEGAPALALGASVTWGVLSVILSPCHLASIPLVVGFISGQGRISTARAGAIATLFASGMLVTIAAIGGITAAAGRMLGDIGSWGNYLVAALFFIVGLNLLGWLPDAWSAPAQTRLKRRGMLAAFVLGLVFGIALGPCTFAFMAPMLGVTFRLAGAAPVYGAALLLAYGVGHCGVIAVAGTSTELVQRVLNWNEQSRGLLWLKRVCGVLVIAGAAYLIYAAN